MVVKGGNLCGTTGKNLKEKIILRKKKRCVKLLDLEGRGGKRGVSVGKGGVVDLRGGETTSLEE